MYHEHPQINLNVKVANTANMAEEVLDKQLHLALIEGPVPTKPPTSSSRTSGTTSWSSSWASTIPGASF